MVLNLYFVFFPRQEIDMKTKCATNNTSPWQLQLFLTFHLHGWPATSGVVCECLCVIRHTSGVVCECLCVIRHTRVKTHQPLYSTSYLTIGWYGIENGVIALWAFLTTCKSSRPSSSCSMLLMRQCARDVRFSSKVRQIGNVNNLNVIILSKVFHFLILSVCVLCLSLNTQIVFFLYEEEVWQCILS